VLAQTGIRDAIAVRRRGRLVRPVKDLHDRLEAIERIIEQTGSGYRRTPNGATQIVR
jgi:hypothetical protein